MSKLLEMKYSEILEQITVQLKRGISQSEIANAIGKEPRVISQRKKRNSKFDEFEIQQLESAFNVKLAKPTKEDDNEMKLKDIIDKISYQQGRHITREEIGRIFGVTRQRVTAMLNSPLPPHRIKILEDIFKTNLEEDIITKSNNDDFYKTPIYGNVQASCGNGLMVIDDSQTAYFPVSKQLLKQIGASQKDTNIIFAKGDSMTPEIKDGDALMVDCSKREVIDGQIYVIRYDGQLLCKRLQKMPPNSVKVISDNGKYDAYYIDYTKGIDFDFEVIGRVMWYSRIAR